MHKLITRLLTFAFCLSLLPPASAWLHWQPPQLQNHEQGVKLLLQAKPAEPGSSQGVSGKPPLSPLTITAHAGQIFTICSQQVRTDEDSTLLVTSDQPGMTPHQLILSHPQTTLHIEKPYPCPPEDISLLPYGYQGILYSPEPFLVTSEETSKQKEKNETSPAPFAGVPKTGSSKNLLSDGGGLGPDDDNAFKPPFQPPFAGQSDITLILLPFLKLPPEWQEQWPGSHWFHWVFGEPDYDSGSMLNIQVNGESVARLPIHSWELRELAEDLTNSRQLLQKLAHQLNGREAFIEQLLDILATGDQSFIDEETRERIEQQLADVLEQSDHTFSLELEWFSLHTALLPKNAIITTGLGKDKKEKASSGQATGGHGQKQKSASGGQSSQSGRSSKQPPDKQEGQQAPGSSGYNAERPTSELAAQYYILEVESHRYYLEKKAMAKEDEPANKIRVTAASSDESILLSQIESNTSISVTTRIGSHGDVLDYLLRYGTPETLREYHQQYNKNTPIPESEIQQVSRTLFAALNGRSNIVRLLMKTGDTDPLQHAVQQRLITCTRYLLEQGSSADAFYEDDTTPLHIAVGNQDEAMVQLFLRPQYHANPNSPRASDGITPFHLAIQQGLLSIAQHLHKAGADRYLASADDTMPWAMIPEGITRPEQDEMNRLTLIQNPDSNEQFELFLQAIEHEDVNAVTNFMQFGPDLLLEGQQQSLLRAQGRFPLHIAVETGNPEIVYKLVKIRNLYKGPVEQHSSFYEIINGVRKSDMCAPLHVAVIKYDEVFRAWQKADGAVVVAKGEARGNASNPALMQAYSQAEKEKQRLAKKADAYLTIIDTLLNHSANPNVQRQSDGATPLYIASERGLLKVVQKLTLKTSRDKENPKAQVNQPRRLDKATPLYAAAREGHTAVVEHLLTTLANANARTQGANGKYPLEIALENGHFGTANKLASKGDQLFNACREGNIEFVRTAMKAGISPNTDRRGSFALIHCAAESGNNDIVQLLLDHKANIDKTYLHGNTALHYAAMHGHFNVVKTLLEHDSKAWMTPNSTRFTPLQLALLNHHRGVANLLVEHEHGTSLFVAVEESDVQYLKRLKIEGVTTSVINPKTGNTPLHEAVRMNRHECVTELMDEQLLEQENNEGQTPLSLALKEKNRFVLYAFSPFLPSVLLKSVELNQPEKVAAILDAGISPNEQDETSGEYPLHLAARKGYNDIVTLLLEKQAYPDLISDNKKLTPVEEALNQQHHSTVMLLLDKGESDAWFSAARNNVEGLIDRLINAGVSVNRVDSAGETALHKAAKYGSLDAVRLLLSKRADKSLKNRNNKTACQLARSAGYGGEILELLDNPICNIL